MTFYGNLYNISAPLTALAVWVAWYAWRFVLTPWLHPQEPKELPYFIPVIGHLASMLKSAHELYSRGRLYIGNTREPFITTIMGESMYIVTSADDVSAVYKMPKALDFDPFIKEQIGILGVNKSTLDKMFNPDYAAGKSWMDMSHDTFRLQLHPGERFDSLQDIFFQNLNELMTFENIDGPMLLESQKPTPHKTVSLWKWAQEVLIDAATKTFFDPVLYELAPDLKKQYYTFEDESWKLPFQFPHFAARRLYESKDYLEDALTRYMRLPRNERTAESWLVRSIDEQMKELGIEEKQRSPPMLSFYRLINTNAYKLTFWLTSHILFDQELLQEILYETGKALSADGELSMSTLINECPILNSCYEETLRIANAPMGVRIVTTPTLVGGKLLKPGPKLLMPYRQMHFDPEVFGENINDFEPRRFPKKNLTKSTSWRPFGGAQYHCPGRFLARREVLFFVALLLQRFHLTPVGKNGKAPTFPKMDDTLPSGGIQHPQSGEDVMLQVQSI